MNKKYLDILRCPNDGFGFAILSEVIDSDDKIETANLICKKCNKTYRIIDGIPRFVEGQGYAQSFGFQWKRHSRTQLDIEKDYNEKTFFAATGFTKNEIKGKLFLDVGCGIGRYSKFILKYGGELVGIDMSNAVSQAKKNFKENTDSSFIQADISRLPFKNGVFDYIFSIGVLHHTPDPERSFKALIKYLKIEGSISISVYNQGSLLYEWSKRLRKYTTRMSKRNLYNLCVVACRVLYPIYRIPILKLLIYYIPIDMHPNYDWRLLSTFDAYSPKYASTHTYPEVYKWFKSVGLVDLELLPAPVSIRGKKQN